MIFPYILEDTERLNRNEKPTTEADEVQVEDFSYDDDDDILLAPGMDDFVESHQNLLLATKANITKASIKTMLI